MSKLSFWFYLHCHTYNTSIKDLSQTSNFIYQKTGVFVLEGRRRKMFDNTTTCGSIPSLKFLSVECRLLLRTESIQVLWIYGFTEIPLTYSFADCCAILASVTWYNGGQVTKRSTNRSACVLDHELPGVTTQLYLSCNHPPCLFVYFIGVFFLPKDQG